MGRRKKAYKLEDYMLQVGQTQEKSWKEQRDDAVIEQIEAKRTKVKGITENHDRYLKAIETSVITICVGPAGTGKTYMACGTAAEMLREGRIDRVVLSRPIQGCDEDPGFLPGDLKEKYGPVMQPMFDAFGDFLDRKEIEEFRAHDQIMVVPLAYMRGRTFHNSMVILDEAQNATFGQLRMLLTRFGRNSRVIVNGDHTQSDLKGVGSNPLFEAIQKFQDRPSFRKKPISVVRMTRKDIVRHPLIQWIDETLTGDFEETNGHEDTTWHSIPCPECRSNLWYDGNNEQDEMDPNIKCWHCNAVIELVDEDGKFDPLVLDTSVGNIYSYKTYQDKP